MGFMFRIGIEPMPKDFKQVALYTVDDGQGGYCSVKVLIDASREMGEADQSSIRIHAERICNAIMAETIRIDPAAIARREEERANIIGLFDEPIFVEEIPNGYCSQ